VAGNYRGWFLRYCEENMPANAPKAEAMQARFRANGHNVSQMVTADKLLKSWRSVLQALTCHVAREAGKEER
jgi:hypothetical protein